MSAASRFTVPGEDLPWLIAPLVAALGLASTVAVTLSFGTIPRASVAAAAPPIPDPAPVPVPAAVPVPIPVVAAAPAAAATCSPVRVLFDNASATPTKQSAVEVQALAAWLVAHPNVTAVLDGHADARGNEHANLKLSHQRADAVAATLTAAGVNRQRLTVRGFGAFSPVEDEREDASINRRVVVHFMHNTSDECPHVAPEGNVP